MPNAVELKQRGLICRQVSQGSALLCRSILLQSFVAHAGSHQHLCCKCVSKSPSRGRGWCATSDPSLGYGGAVKGVCLLVLFPRVGKERLGVNAATGGFGWGRRICSCPPSHGWGHFMLGRAVWMGRQPFRSLRQSHLERQRVSARPTPMSGSEFDTSSVLQW